MKKLPILLVFSFPVFLYSQGSVELDLAFEYERESQDIPLPDIYYTQPWKEFVPEDEKSSTLISLLERRESGAVKAGLTRTLTLPPTPSEGKDSQRGFFVTPFAFYPDGLGGEVGRFTPKGLSFSLKGSYGFEPFPHWWGGSLGYRKGGVDLGFSGGTRGGSLEDEFFSYLYGTGIFLEDTWSLKGGLGALLYRGDLNPVGGVALPFVTGALVLGGGWGINLSMESRSLWGEAQDSSWNLSPQGELNYSFEAEGDWTLGVGIRGDWEGKNRRIYPEGKLMFRRNGRGSLFVETRAKRIPLTKLYTFLVEELYSDFLIKTSWYRDTQGGGHILWGDLYLFAAGGYRQGKQLYLIRGKMEELEAAVPYGSFTLSWQPLKGFLIEIEGYADYEGEKNGRFMGEVRWVGDSYRLTVFGGSREVLEAHPFLYNDAGEVLLGLSGQWKPFSGGELGGMVGYGIREARFEGGLFLRFYF